MTTGAMVNQDAVAEALRRNFEKRFGSSPRLFRAPGRVNLIGEHTDYNEGFVMPAAIEFYTWVAAASRADNKLRVHSNHFDETVEFLLTALEGEPCGHWSDYVRGVAAVLRSEGKRVTGVDLLVQNSVPLGAGLSSSAALETAVAMALGTVSGITLSPLEVVEACQKAEHEYAGMRCGIMDQFVATFARNRRRVPDIYVCSPADGARPLGNKAN